MLAVVGLRSEGDATRASGERDVFIDEAALPWMQSRDALDLSRMGVCAFAPSVWRLHGGVASVLRAGGLRGARFQSEAATGEAFFLEAGGRGWTLPRCRMTLAGIGPAGGLRSSRMAQGRPSFGPEANRVKHRGRSVAGRPRDGGRSRGARAPTTTPSPAGSLHRARKPLPFSARPVCV